jgi:esterase/lipase superfamily enzyme
MRQQDRVVYAKPPLVPLPHDSDDQSPRVLAEPVSDLKQPSDKFGYIPKAARKIDQQFTRIQVFYATDRELGSTSSSGFGSRNVKAQGLQYGACEISIPKLHKTGKLESPSFMRLEFFSDPKKHIRLQQTWKYSEQTFVEEVSASIKKSSTKDAFVFVHGYNVSFEDAARRTGQIAFDLHFIGAPIFYSWPSNGKVADYLKDETNVRWSTPHFQRFLGLLSERSGAERIHIIAHSLGNRLVCDALEKLSYDPESRLRLNHLVLAAPDIDADTFRELAAALQKCSGRVTVYESSDDIALKVSKRIHGNPRAGEPLLIVPGLDTIDVSAIDTNFLGHSYFSDSWPLLSDIHSILLKDDPPAARFGLDELVHSDGNYYAFRAQNK